MIPAAGDPMPAAASVRRRFGALLCLGTLTLFLPGVWNAGFGYDDQAALLENPLVVGSRSAWDAFRQDFWEHRGEAGLYRPLVTLSMRAQAQGAAPVARPFHIANLMLHLYVLLAWLWFLRAELARRPALWLGFALFAWHPLQSEVVVWIPRRSSSLCALLGSAPLLGWSKVPPSRRWILACLGTLAALFVKEDGVAFAALYACLLPARERWTLLLSLSVYAWFRLQALGSSSFGSPTAPLAALGWFERALVGLRVGLWSFSELFWPVGHPLALRSTDLAPFPLWRIGVVAAAVVLLLLAKRFARQRPPRPWSALERGALAGLSVACLPWLQWVPAPELWGPRALYLPLLFSIPLWSRLHVSSSLLAPSLGVGLVAALFGVHKLAPAYQDALGYWTYRSQYESGKSEVWNGLGNEYFARGRWDAAEGAFSLALQNNPNYSRAWVGMGLCAEQRGHGQRAEDAYEKALALQPNNPVALANRARLYSRAGQWEAAQRLYERATEVQPGRAEFWRGLARCARKCNEPEVAHKALREALRLDPGDPRTRALQLRGLR